MSSQQIPPILTNVRLVAQADLPTGHGPFVSYGFRDQFKNRDVVALLRGSIEPGGRAPLVRMHSQCLTGDVFGSRRCDCGAQLARAMSLMDAENCGLVIYEFDEGRGIGILNKLRAYALQDDGADTVDANLKLGLPVDARSYETSIAILEWFSLTRVRLLTNNPRKVGALTRRGIAVERVPLVIDSGPTAASYLKTKKTRLGHCF